MQCDIRIRSPTYPLATELVVSHGSEETILQLKTKIRDALCNPALLESTQKLIYSGHVLEDHKTLTQHNIPNNATFHLVTPPSILPLSAQSSAEPLETNVHAQPRSHNSTISNSNIDVAHTSALPEDLTPAASSLSAQASELGADSVDVGSNQVPAIPTQETPDTHRPAVGFPGLSSAAQSFLAEQADVQRTSVKYELCYVDGFPYLVRSNDRRTRNYRRPRHLSNILGDHVHQQHTTTDPTPAASQARTSPLPIRQHHVDLPATAAIPVRTAEGRRALILSPEGVRAMAAQGVNVETAAANRRVLGFSSAEFRRFMSTTMPYAWLALKLAFIVGMLGTNSTWSRFLILNLVAIIIFLWQSGILSRAFFGHPQRQPTPETQTGAPQARAAGRAAEAMQDGREHPNTTGIETSRPRPDSTDVRHNLAESGDVPVLQHTWLQSFSNAFISSIMPGAPRRDARLIRAAANVAVAQRAPDVPSPGASQIPDASRGHDFSDPVQTPQGNQESSDNSPDEERATPEVSANENETEDRNRAEAQLNDNLSRDW